MHVAQIPIKSKGLKLYGDEIFLAGRCIGRLNPALPFVTRAEVIDLLEGHVACELGRSDVVSRIKTFIINEEAA